MGTGNLTCTEEYPEKKRNNNPQSRTTGDTRKGEKREAKEEKKLLRRPKLRESGKANRLTLRLGVKKSSPE